MRRFRGLCLLPVVSWFLVGCHLPFNPPHAPTAAAPSGEFAIYLLADGRSPQQLVGADLRSLPLQPQPALSEDDLIAYHWDPHDLELTPAAYARLQHLQVPVSGLPFVVAVGQGRIYSGAFWTPLSSLSYDGIVIETPLAAPEHSLRIQLGYPESPELFRGTDRRADPRIHDALERAGKLESRPPQ